MKNLRRRQGTPWPGGHHQPPGLHDPSYLSKLLPILWLTAYVAAQLLEGYYVADTILKHLFPISTFCVFCVVLDYVGRLSYQYAQELAAVHKTLAATDDTVRGVAESVRATTERGIALDTALQGLQDNTTKDTNALRTDFTRTRDELTGVQNLLNATRKVLIGVQNEVDAARNDFAGVMTAVTGAKNELTGLQTKVAGARVEVTSARAEVAGARAEFTGIQEEVARARAEVTGATNDLTRLQSKLTEAKNQLHGARDELTGSGEELPIPRQYPVTTTQPGLHLAATPTGAPRTVEVATNADIAEGPAAALETEPAAPQPARTMPHPDVLPPCFVEHLETRLAAQREAMVEEFHDVARSAVESARSETARYRDESSTIRAVAEGSLKAATAVQESLSSQGEYIARLEGELHEFRSAFGDDPVAFVQALVSTSNKPINDWVTTVEVQAVATCKRVDEHDAMLTEHGASVDWQRVRLDGHDWMLNTLHEDVAGQNRRLDGHDGRFDGLDAQLDDVGARYDARCDGLDTRLHSHDSRFDARDEQYAMVDTRLDAHGLQLELVIAHDERIHAHDATLDAHTVRHNVHDTRSATHDARIDAHDTRFRTHDTQLETHNRQLYEHDEQLDGHYEASAAVREEVARIQADVVKVLSSLGDDQALTIDSALAYASLPLRSRLKHYDKAVADLIVRIDKVNGTLAKEQDKRGSMQTDLDSYRGALGDDPKATLRCAIAEAVDPLVTRMDGHDERVEGLCGRLDTQDGTVATIQNDLASIQGCVDVIGDALGDDPVAAMQKAAASVTEPTNDLLQDLGKELASLVARLDGLESLSSDDRQAVTGLQADVCKMLMVFGDDPQATIRKAITEYLRSLESRVKYLEDKRSGLQDQAEKNQAATIAVRKEISAAQADLLRVTRALACQTDKMASLRAHIVRVEGKHAGASVRECPQSPVEALHQNGHESSRPHETTIHTLLAPDVSVQDVNLKIRQELDYGDSSLSEKVDEGSSPVMLTRSLAMDGLCDIIADGEETSALDETPETALIVTKADSEAPSTVEDVGSIPPTDACDNLMDEGGYGLCSSETVTFTRSCVAQGITVAASDPVRELEDRLRLSTASRHHLDPIVRLNITVDACDAYCTYDALSRDALEYERYLASGDLHAADVLKLIETVAGLRSATLPGQLTSRKRYSKNSNMNLSSLGDSDSLLSTRTLGTDTLIRALTFSVIELVQVFSLVGNQHDTSSVWWPLQSTSTTAGATSCCLSEQMQEVMMTRHDELVARFKTYSQSNGAAAGRVVVRRELVVVQCLAVAVGRLSLADCVELDIGAADTTNAVSLGVRLAKATVELVLAVDLEKDRARSSGAEPLEDSASFQTLRERVSEHTKLVNALYVSLFKSAQDAHLRELWLDLGAIADNLTGYKQPKINLSQSHDVLVAILDALEASAAFGKKSRGLKKDIKLQAENLQDAQEDVRMKAASQWVYGKMLLHLLNVWYSVHGDPEHI